MKKGDTIFIGQYLFTGSETTSVWLEVRLSLKNDFNICLIIYSLEGREDFIYLGMYIYLISELFIFLLSFLYDISICTWESACLFIPYKLFLYKQA